MRSSGGGRKTENPYYLGDAGKKVADVLVKCLWTELIRKQMTLLGETEDGWFR